MRSWVRCSCFVVDNMLADDHIHGSRSGRRVRHCRGYWNIHNMYRVQFEV